MVTVMVNVNLPSHSEIQLFKNLTMNIQGQGHVFGQRSRSHLTLKIQRSTAWSRSNPLVTFEAWSSIDMFGFPSWQSDHFWVRYSKFHIWPWKFKVKVMAKVKASGHIWGITFKQYVCFYFVAIRPFLAEIKQIPCLTLRIQDQGHNENWPKLTKIR